jgi:hypothetical protein
MYAMSYHCYIYEYGAKNPLKLRGGTWRMTN